MSALAEGRGKEYRTGRGRGSRGVTSTTTHTGKEGVDATKVTTV